jgi:hypothetical protein
MIKRSVVEIKLFYSAKGILKHPHSQLHCGAQMKQGKKKQDQTQ